MTDKRVELIAESLSLMETLIFLMNEAIKDEEQLNGALPNMQQQFQQCLLQLQNTRGDFSAQNRQQFINLYQKYKDFYAHCSFLSTHLQEKMQQHVNYNDTLVAYALFQEEDGD